MNYLRDIKTFRSSFPNANHQQNVSMQKSFRSKNSNGLIGSSDQDGFGVVIQKKLLFTIVKGPKYIQRVILFDSYPCHIFDGPYHMSHIIWAIW